MTRTLIQLGLTDRTALAAARCRAGGEAALVRAIARDGGEALGGESMVVLSTCERLEVYAFAHAEVAGRIVSIVGNRVGESGRAVDVDRRVGTAAAAHLFAVATGLESRLIGEPHILGQVSDAPKRTGASGPLARLFQDAVARARRVRMASGLDRVAVSCVDLAISRAVGEVDPDGRAAVVGSGALARETAVRLVELGLRVTVFARHAERAAASLPPTVWVAPLDRLAEDIGDIGLLVAATSSPIPVILPQHLGKRSGSLLLIDLGMPANIDAAVRQQTETSLVTLDDLLDGQRQPAEVVANARALTAAAAALVAPMAGIRHYGIARSIAEDRRMTRRPLIILAAHGSGDESAANRRIREIASALGARCPDSKVIAAFKLGVPTVADVLAEHPDRGITIVPVMTSAGYFAGEYLRRVICGAKRTQNTRITEPVGLSPRIAPLVVESIRQALGQSAWGEAATTIIIVGHGTSRSATSGGATIAIAEEAHAAFPQADVRPAFLDQEPRLENAALGTHAIIYPFLIGGGEHVLSDVPARLGLCESPAGPDGVGTRTDGRAVHVLESLGDHPDFPAIVLDHVNAVVPHQRLRIGTRSSPLAFWQADQAAAALEAMGAETERVIIDTEGDRDVARPLDDFATDGPFTDALEHALLQGRIDVAIHSLKDLPLEVLPGTSIAAVLPRGPVEEAMVAADGRTLADLPPGARIGTCSRRRAAQLLRLRPDIRTSPIRGTVQQRVAQVANGTFDAAILAVAGLVRSGLESAITQVFALDEIMPEAGQGAIALQVRANNPATTALVARIDHEPTRVRIETERLFAQQIGEKSGLIAAAVATFDGTIHLRARAFSANGAIWRDVSATGADPQEVAEAALRAAGSDRASRADRFGTVALIGAGPGDPGLITVRGLQLLQNADCVIYDRLVDRSLLESAKAEAERIDAGKAPGRHTLAQDQINDLIVEKARDGRAVVRLKGGDPFVFGRGWEELQACREADISCEVVSGVTSAIAAPAAAGIPVTARGVARTFAVVTPQAESGAPTAELDYDALARIDTVVFLMSRGLIGHISGRLIAAGRSAETPAAVIQDGTLPTQRQVVGTLATIAQLADDAGIRAPAVLVVGDTAGLPEATASRGPLRGKRVLVTRPPTASPGLMCMLRAEGAEPINCPLIRIEYRTPGDLSALQQDHVWTVFTSLHAVRGFWRVLRSIGRDARALGACRVAAVGPKTAAELRAIGINADLVPDIHRASALIEAITSSTHAGRILFPCGTLARDELRAGLRAHGLTVDELAVYDTLAQMPTSEACTEIERGLDAILLYCPSGAISAAEAGLLSHDVPIACIGPTTGEKVRDLGFEPAVVPAAHTDRGLIDALAEFFQHRHATQGAVA